MRILWIVALLATSLSVQSQSLEDVIYKKDGSVLRGTLVEQDFENGRYKIQLQGGSQFSVNKSDIEKITKEAPTSSQNTNSSGININIDNSPSITQNPVIEQNPVITNSINTTIRAPHPKSVFFIGSVSKRIDNDDENGFIYRGINLAYQYTFSEYFSVYVDHNRATMEGVLVEGDLYDMPYVDIDDYTHQSTQVLFMASTNTQQGWQFYTGLGSFTESTDLNSSTLSTSGVAFALGMGYSWERVQLQFRIIGQSSDDYKKLGDDYSGSTTNLQLGYNF